MRILMATGGSPHSEATLRFGALIAQRVAATATVLTVIKRRSDRPRAASVHDRARLVLGAERVEVTTTVRVGHPAEEIIREAEDGNYDVVIVGEKQHAGLVTRFLLGSTAVRVVEHAPCPVVVAKGHIRRLRRMLLCDSGAVTPPLIARFAEQLGDLLTADDDVTVLHVMSQIPAGPGVDDALLAADAEALIARREPEGEMLAQDLEVLSHLRLRPRAKVRHGIVIDEILTEAGEGDYDLVVIGAYRGEGWRRILLDDLAHEIIVKIDRPILIVR